MLTGKFVMLTS